MTEGFFIEDIDTLHVKLRLRLKEFATIVVLVSDQVKQIVFVELTKVFIASDPDLGPLLGFYSACSLL